MSESGPELSAGKALAALVVQSGEQGAVRHYWGLPEGLRGDRGSVPMPPATVLAVVREPRAGFVLYRFGVDGSDAGDTWHPTVAEAKGQADFEFGPHLRSWIEFVPDPTNLSGSALRSLRAT